MTNLFNYSLAAFLLTFVFVFSSAAQTRSVTANRQLETWKIFSPAGNHFKVSLPAEPEKLNPDETQKIVSEMSSRVKKSRADIEVMFLNNVSVYNLEAQWNGFRIVVIDYKWQEIDYDEKSGVITLSNETVSDNAVLREWMEFDKAKMHSNGVFVCDMTFFEGGFNYKARVFATKNRIYMLYVGTPDLNSATPALAGVYQAEADKFFNSFQISDNKPQIARGTAKSAKSSN